MNLIKCYQTTSDWYKGALRNSTPVGILWHDTAGGNPQLKRYVQPSDDAKDKEEMLKLLGKNKYGNDWNHSSRTAGLNAWIGQLADGSLATIQAGDWSVHPWGCGGGSKGSCNGYIIDAAGKRWVNRHWIQFEICDDGYKDESYFKKAYKEAVEFTAYICQLFNIDPNGTVEFNGVKVPTILCHADSHKLALGGNHGDIYSWFNKFGYDMDNVRADVAKLLNKEPVVETTPKFHLLDEVRIRDGVTTFASGKGMASWVPKAKLYVRRLEGDKVVVSTLKEGAVTGTVFNTDLILVKCAEASVEEVNVPAGYASTGSDKDQEVMWNNFLKLFGGNEYAAAGLMGNIYAESALKSNNLQQSYERKLGYTDASYTAAVDTNVYTAASFIHDSAGYGLCQWTYNTRKEAMLKHHQEAGKSISDFETQLSFIDKEFTTTFKKLRTKLIAATSVRETSDLILIEFEAPASCREETTQIKRAEYSQKYYDKFRTIEESEIIVPPVEETPEVEEPVIVPDEPPIEEHSREPESSVIESEESTGSIPEDPADSEDASNDANVETEPNEAEIELRKEDINHIINWFINIVKTIIGWFRKK